jgi:hypothetical protein
VISRAKLKTCSSRSLARLAFDQQTSIRTCDAWRLDAVVLHRSKPELRSILQLITIEMSVSVCLMTDDEYTCLGSSVQIKI